MALYGLSLCLLIKKEENQAVSRGFPIVDKSNNYEGTNTPAFNNMTANEKTL